VILLLCCVSSLPARAAECPDVGGRPAGAVRRASDADTTP